MEQLVEEGHFPSVEAVVEAALEQLEPATRSVAPAEIAAAAEQGRADFAEGRVRDGDQFAAELRARAQSRPA